MKLLANALLLSLLVLAPVACSSDEETLCDLECDCEGCNDFTYGNCLNSYDERLRRAEIRGCPDFYDDWVACREATAFCDFDFDIEFRCGPERSRLDACID